MNQINTHPTIEEQPHDYQSHLYYDEFKKPTLFRIECVKGKTIIPSVDIELQIFTELHNLEANHYDVAAEIIETDDGIEQAYEFAFDATEVDDPKSILDDVQTLLQNYNEPPDDLPEEGKEKWREAIVAISHITGLETEEAKTIINSD